MPTAIYLLLLLRGVSLTALAQPKTPVDFGYRHLRMRQRKTNFSFHAYLEVEHNFFGFTNGQIDYEKGQWDRVARDFLAWMQTH